MKKVWSWTICGMIVIGSGALAFACCEKADGSSAKKACAGSSAKMPCAGSATTVEAPPVAVVPEASPEGSAAKPMVPPGMGSGTKPVATPVEVAPAAAAPEAKPAPKPMGSGYKMHGSGTK